MRDAPAVTVDLPEDAAARGVQAVLCALAAAAAVAGVLQQFRVPALAVGASLACAGVAAGLLAWHRTPFARGRLRWDGRGWWFLQAGAREDRPGRLNLMIDLGDRMLLRFQPDASCTDRRPAWLACVPLPAAQAVPLRAAVYCRRLNPDHPPHRGREPR